MCAKFPSRGSTICLITGKPTQYECECLLFRRRPEFADVFEKLNRRLQLAKTFKIEV